MAGTPKKTDSTSPKAKNSPTKKDAPSKKDTPTKKVSPSKKDSPTKEDKKVSPTKDVDAATQALNLFAQGKRHLLVNDINSAVDSLQEACRMLAEQHGETATECGDAYFYYGRALLELSRIESGVLGNALDGVPEGEDLDNSQVENPDKMPAEEKEKVAEQVGEALEENFKSLEKASSKDSKDKVKEGKSDEPMEDDKSKDGKSDTKDKEKSDKDEKAESAMDTDSADKGSDDESEDESQEEGEDETGEDETGEEMEAEGKEDKEGEEKEGEKTEDADDVSNLQLAWEMLELAKVIYQRQAEGDKAMALKTAQVFLKLGEVCLENENYPQSIEDFQSCLKLQETHLEADDRCLAETHYQLGVALSFSDDFDKAIESFTKSLKIIQERIAILEKAKKEGSSEKQKDAKTKDDASDSEDAEIKELNNLIPEIKEKITDMEEMKKDTKDKINKVKKELGMASAIGGPSSKEIEGTANAFGSSSTSSDAKPIETTMIRNKRKPEDEVGDEPKKTKAVNGEAKPSENGKSSPDKMDTDKESKSDDSKDELKTKAAEDMAKKTKELKKQAA